MQWLFPFSCFRGNMVQVDPKSDLCDERCVGAYSDDLLSSITTEKSDIFGTSVATTSSTVRLMV